MKHVKDSYILMGAIVGDYMGSTYKLKPTKEVDFPIDVLHSNLTDNSILTIAVADALLSGIPYKYALHYWGIKYPSPMGGYGGYFNHWLANPKLSPYNSFDSGSAARVSATGWLEKTLEDTLWQARNSSVCTHNHPEGINGACAVAACIYMLRNYRSRADVMEYVEQQFGYDLHFDLEELRETYKYTGRSAGCVPVAIKCYLESTSWENAVRLAVSMGGNADTLGAITGAIAMADMDKAYDIPRTLVQLAWAKLSLQQQSIVEEFERIVDEHEKVPF